MNLLLLASGHCEMFVLCQPRILSTATWERGRRRSQNGWNTSRVQFASPPMNGWSPCLALIRPSNGSPIL
jgi:hypothetical protein